MNELINTVFLFVILGVIVAYALEWAVVGSSLQVLIGGSFGLLLYIAIHNSKNQKLNNQNGDMGETDDKR